MHLTESVALVASGEMRLGDQYDCNVYLLECPDGAVLLDTGVGRKTDELLDRCRGSFDEPGAALLTHAHADHSQGGPDLQGHDIPVIAPTTSESLLRNGSDEELGLAAARRDGAYPSDYEFTHYSPDSTVEPGETAVIQGQDFQVIQFHGHAVDHVCYLTEIDGRQACFVGDAVAADGRISLLNVAGSSLQAYREDIGNLTGRAIDMLFPGHGLPLLEDGQSAIDTAADALSGMFTPPTRT